MAEKERGRILSWLWPDTNTPEGMKKATAAGAVAAGWLAVSSAYFWGVLLWTGSDPSGYKPEDQAEFIFFVTSYPLWILFCAFLGWRLLKHQGHISALIILILVVLEVIGSFLESPGRGIVLIIILVSAAINGVRGSFEYRRWLKEHERETI